MTGEEADVEPSSTPCPRCGEPVPAGADECPACEQPVCPECGAAVGLDWSSCVACGARWDLFCPECNAVVKPRDRYCPECGISFEAGADDKAPPPVPAPPAAPSPPAVWPSTPSCSVCGRQDETLRAAAFPYVVSLLIVSMRRTFAGIWCRKHRSLYWALSSAITSLIGWFGIPFGVIFTPVALFKLAMGGDQPAPQNRQMLWALAEHKLQAGDGEGAIRCLEEALRLGDDEATRLRLQSLHALWQPFPHQGPRARVWPLFAAILGAAAVGLAMGLADYAITAGFLAVAGEESSLFLGILSWVPWVTLLFLGGLALTQIVEWALRRSACRRMGLGIALAVVSAIVALHGTQQGEVVGNLVSLVLSGEAPGDLFEALLVVGFVLTVGGAFFVADQVQQGSIAGTIYLVILAVAAIYYVGVSIRAAKGTVRWQQVLAAVRPRAG
jgi:Double zinc ribbon